jgi:Homeodomain-like domain
VRQTTALEAMAESADRAEADRARAILLTLSGWTSARIAEAFRVHEDTARLWRSEFMRDGVAAIKASLAPGPPPVKATAALKGRRATSFSSGRRPHELDARPACRGDRTARDGDNLAIAALQGPTQKKKGLSLAEAAAHPEGPSGSQRH